MFSVVVAGRLPLPPPQQVDETHALFLIEDAANINHVTVFMTGAQAFPPGYAATVHLNWRGGVAEDRWILLGCLKNDKPSSIYRLRGVTTQANAGNNSFGNASQSTTAPSTTAALGISIEPVQQVDEQMAALASSRGSGNGTSNGGTGMSTDAGGMDMEGSSSQQQQQLALVRASSAGAGDPAMQMQMALALAPKIASSAFSYLSSFAPDSAPQTVPLLKRWLEGFERKLKMQGLGFLEKSETE